MTRERLLEQLAERVVSIQRHQPLRVAIDGIDAAGKTTLADELLDPIERRGRPVIRASLDGFHRPRVERYRQGADSPRGYYEDSFNYPLLREALLLPLGPHGSRQFRRAVFDHRKDAPLPPVWERAPENAVLLIDGIFLLRPELDDLWDYRIFVDVSFNVALERALERDQSLLGPPTEVRARYFERYFPAQRMYLDVARPREQADIVVENDDPDHATMIPASR